MKKQEHTIELQKREPSKGLTGNDQKLRQGSKLMNKQKKGKLRGKSLILKGKWINKMITTREKALRQSVRDIKKLKRISIDDLDNLLIDIDKVLMQLVDVTNSRTRWKSKYMELKNAK